MAYTKKTFQNGDILTASDMNSIEDAIVGLETLPTKDTHRLLLPTDLYFLDGNKLPIFQRFCVSNENNLDKMRFCVGRIDGGYPYLQQVHRDILLNPSDYDDTLRIVAKYGDDYTSEIVACYKDINVRKTDSTSLTDKTATIIMSGDSIIDYNITKAVGQKFEALNVTLSFQGTQNDGVPYYNEGRAAWEYRNFYGKNTRRNFGDPIFPQASGNTGTLYQNPFIRVATASEISAHPEWCFENHPSLNDTGVDNELNYTESQTQGGYTGNYYTVSIIDYIANHGITVGDKLIWISNWGFNDLNHNSASAQSISDALLGMEILANRLRDYADANPTKDIILGISPLLIVQIFNKWNGFSSYLEQAIKKVKSLNASLHTSNFKVELVPVWMSVDRSFGWNYPSSGTGVSELSADNDTLYSSPADVTHPGDVGKQQIANVIVNYIAYKLTEQSTTTSAPTTTLAPATQTIGFEIGGMSSTTGNLNTSTTRMRTLAIPTSGFEQGTVQFTYVIPTGCVLVTAWGYNDTTPYARITSFTLSNGIATFTFEGGYNNLRFGIRKDPDGTDFTAEEVNASYVEIESTTTQSATTSAPTSAPTTQAPVVTTQAPTQAPTTTQAPSVTYQNLVQNSNIVENAGVSTSVTSTWTNDNLGSINEDSNIPNDSAGGRKMSSFNIPSWASSSGNVKLRPTFEASAGATYHVYFDVACSDVSHLGDCLIDVSNTTSWQSVTITDADTSASASGAPAQLSYQASVGTSVVRKHFIITGTFANGDNLNIHIFYGSCDGTAVTMYFGRVQIATNPNAQYIETSGTIVE